MIKSKYDKVALFEDGFAYVWQNNKMGLVNKVGEEVVKPQFDTIEHIIKSLKTQIFVTKHNKEIGFIIIHC